MDWTHTDDRPTEAQDPRAYEETFIRWIPLAVPLLGAAARLRVPHRGGRSLTYFIRSGC